MTGTPVGPRGRNLWALLTLLAAHAMPVLFLVSRPDAGSESWDQNYHHAVLVSRFAQTIDAPDLSDYPSATSPGYHLLLGALVRAGLVPEEEMRALYPWTDRAVEQPEMIRRSRLAQGMSQFRMSGQDTILVELERDGTGGAESATVRRVVSGTATQGDRAMLRAEFGPEGEAFVAHAQGDLAAEQVAAGRFRVALLPLRMVQLCASLAALAVVWLVATRLGLSSWTATAVTLTAAWNPYVLAGGAWITTDCIAMLCASVVLLDVVSNAQAGRPPGWLAAGGMIAAVLVRQSFLWVEGAVVVAALIPLVMGDRFPLRRALPSLVAVAVPVSIVAGLALLWGGLVPPAYGPRHGESFNPTAALVFFSVIALWGGSLAYQLRGDRLSAVAGVGLIAFVLAWIPPSAFSTDISTGRFGGAIWRLAHLGPTIGERSVVMAVGASLGVSACVLYARSMRGRGHGREMLVLGGALAVLMASLMVNPKSWERYADVPVVFMLPIIAAAAVRGSTTNLDRRVAISSILPAAVALVVSVFSLLLPALNASRG